MWQLVRVCCGHGCMRTFCACMCAHTPCEFVCSCGWAGGEIQATMRGTGVDPSDRAWGRRERSRRPCEGGRDPCGGVRGMGTMLSTPTDGGSSGAVPPSEIRNVQHVPHRLRIIIDMIRTSKKKSAKQYQLHGFCFVSPPHPRNENIHGVCLRI